MSDTKVLPGSIRAGMLVMSQSNRMRYETTPEDAVGVHFARECSSGKHLGLPLNDDILVNALSFQKKEEGVYSITTRAGEEIVVVKKEDGFYYLFDRKVEAAHVLQGLYFYGTGEELKSK